MCGVPDFSHSTLSPVPSSPAFCVTRRAPSDANVGDWLLTTIPFNSGSAPLLSSLMNPLVSAMVTTTVATNCTTPGGGSGTTLCYTNSSQPTAAATTLAASLAKWNTLFVCFHSSFFFRNPLSPARFTDPIVMTVRETMVLQTRSSS
jgi:hypothetical protein